MKKMMYIRLKIAVCAILLSATMFSCVKEEIAESQMTYGDSIRFGISSANDKKGQPKTKSGAVESEPYVIHGEGITATVTVVDGIQSKMNDMPLTKGTQATSVSAFNVAAYLYPDGATSGVDYFSDLVSDGVNPATTRYWPEFGTLDFLAAAPAGIISTMPSASDYENGFSFTYAIPEEVADQQDIMVAVAKDQNNSSTGNPVPLQFQHLLAAVQFKVGDMQFIQINSLKITGVLGGDIKFTYDNATNVWTPDLSSASNTSYSFIHDEANPSLSSLPSTSGLAKGAAITGNDYNTMLLVAPQTLTDAAQIEVNYTETITGLNNIKSASLVGGEWKAGMTTVYALNISGTDFGTVVIPRPDDQDAHYIMLTMEYNMGNILNRDKIKSVKATAKWKDDAVNTSTKTGISLKFASELSETQKQGFWTDKRYIETITVNSSGQSSTTGLVEDTSTDSHNNLGLRGGNYLDIKDATGSIVLFIEENNGTTDREGELIFTATLDTGVEIILGNGQFKQLCPSRNDEGIGVERIETDDKSYAYGFDYTRKVIYTNPGDSWWILKNLGRALYTWGASSVINDDEGDFITLETGDFSVLGFTITYINSVTLDYGALSEVEDVANSTDGLANTRALYNFTGNVDIGQVELDFDENLNWNKSTPVKGEGTPEDYAAFMALSRNRMYEKKTVVNSSEGNTTTYKAILYKDGATDLEGNDIIEWYLPSSVEAENLKETGVDNEGNQSVIDDLDGTYWSSTAGTDLTPAKANAFVFNANVYSSQNSGPKARTDKYKVRAVRKKPTAN